MCKHYKNKTKIYVFGSQAFVYYPKKSYLSYDVASGSQITPCNKMDKLLAVYSFSGNVMTMRGSRKLCQRGSNFDNFFLVDKGGRIQIPYRRVVISPPAKRH